MTSPAAATNSGWQRFRQNRVAVAALFVLVGMALICFIFPLFLHPARSQVSPNNFLAPGQSGEVLLDNTKTTLKYYWGTDVNGRDLFTRVLEGGRVSLLVGFCAAVLSLVIGTLVGLTAGYLGGKVDSLLMRGVDVLYAIPRLLFMLVIIASLDGVFLNSLDQFRQWADGAQHENLKKLADNAIPYSRIILMILCLGLIEWLTMARIVRGQVLVLREQQFVAAARALGRGPWSIMWKHLLPNLWTVILTYLTLTVPVVILDESFLSFLGLGIEEPAASWGALLKEGSQAINPLESRWWLLICPAAVMSVTLLALNFVGDGLRDAFDVK
jgi:oligopeptide transport system permease protein